uniref:Heparanase n=1 Tax=Rhinopithecus bieti TaxID=61621 RepID=A0A2K6MGM1_RHIBE
MLLRSKPTLPQPPPLLLLLLGPLGPLSPGALPGPAQAQDVVDLDFFTQQPLHLVSPSFLSVTIDANLATDPRFLIFLGSPKLRTLARGLSPAYLRFGGTKTDFLIFDPKKESTFEERSYWQSQVNRDICKSGSIPPDVKEKLRSEWPYQEQVLLREHYQKKFKNSTYSKPNSFLKKADIFINGSQLGEDFIQLHKLLRKSTFKNAKLCGPDVGQPRRKTAEMLKSFLKAGGEVIDSVTWHHYYLNGRTATEEDFLNPDVLDILFHLTRPGKKVWLGETSSAYGGGAPLLSDTFAAGFMWLDKLGLSAQMGIQVVMRQVFFGAGNYHLVDENFDPLPDYWLSLLFKKLVGTKVLMASVKGPKRRKLRVYLHCTNTDNPMYKEGDLTLYAINLHNVTKYLRLPYPFFDKQVDKYLLRPLGPHGLLSKSVQLNGHTLKMVDDQTLPPLMEKPLRPGSSLGLPAFSYSFFVIRNAKVAACI